MNYQLEQFTLFADENDVVPDVPPWNEGGRTCYRMPVVIRASGWTGGTYRGTFYGSIRDYREGTLPDPAKAVACLVGEIISAYTDPDEFVEMCLPLSTAEQVEQVADVLRFAENHGEALADVLSAEGLCFDEELVRYLRESKEAN